MWVWSYIHVVLQLLEGNAGWIYVHDRLGSLKDCLIVWLNVKCLFYYKALRLRFSFQMADQLVGIISNNMIRSNIQRWTTHHGTIITRTNVVSTSAVSVCTLTLWVLPCRIWQESCAALGAGPPQGLQRASTVPAQESTGPLAARHRPCGANCSSACSPHRLEFS